MAQLNSNEIIRGAIAAGKLSATDAEAIIRKSGFKDQFGQGRVDNYLQGNEAANSSILSDLQARNLIPTVSLNTQMGNTVNNPQLPTGTELIPQTQSVQQGEMVSPVSKPEITKVGAGKDITANTIKGASASLDDIIVNYQDSLSKISKDNATYNPALIGNKTPQMEAAQGEVSEMATIQGQLKKLYADSADGQIPPWAQGAMRKASEVMAARGLGNSSIAASAITVAIQESAINIAAPDAATYFQMDITNLNNEQQANLTNVQLRQQSLLTDTAAVNAAAQFNASSTAQIEQFQAQLIAGIQSQNADRTAAMTQFNTANKIKVEMQNVDNDLQTKMANENRRVTIEQFNSNLEYQAETFYANMSTAIDQSNVNWRRQINTANTATINAANQLNVQNKFNLSNYALNSLWQKSRDEAAWLQTAAKDAQDYQYELGKIAAARNSNAYLNDRKADDEFEKMIYRGIGAIGNEIIQGL